MAKIRISIALLLVGGPLHAAVGDLPAYAPDTQVSGTIRNAGAALFGQVKDWENGFRRFQPGVHFDDILFTGDGYVGGLESGGADVAFSDRDPVLTEYLSFNETFGYDLSPGELDVVTGAFDIKGHSWAVVIYVNKDNPISGLTMQQLDGIFGAARTGGYRGYKWYGEYARGEEGDIRTWGQLGLTGEWADKPIDTYGYAPTGMRNYFERTVFHGGDKWNPNYREYVEYGTKMVAEEPLSSHAMLADDMAKDRYGICWSGVPHAAGMTHLKRVPLAFKDGQPFVEATKETVQDRSYPLSRPLHVFIKHPPGKPVDPKLREFVRYILSRQGQEDVVKNGALLPLTPAVVAAQLKKLE